jgi:hypothetical protein
MRLRRWWDEERDASHFANSSVFNSVSGFGGRSPGCVMDGPFAGYSLIIGPGYNNTEHCLSRDIDDVSSQASSAPWLQFCAEASTFEEAWDRIEFYPHSAGHSGVGGEVCYTFQPFCSLVRCRFLAHHKPDRCSTRSQALATLCSTSITPSLTNFGGIGSLLILTLDCTALAALTSRILSALPLYQMLPTKHCAAVQMTAPVKSVTATSETMET